MMNIIQMDTKKVTAIILAIIAIILLILIYRQETVAQKVSNQASPNQRVSQDQRIDQVPLAADFTSADGTIDIEKQKAYLFSITLDSSDEEKSAHYQYATSIATDSEYLNISDCRNIEPLVLRVTDNDEILLKNDGDTDVSFALDQVTSYVVKAKSTKLINADFIQGPGLYGYGCQNSSGRGSGMLFVTPKS